MINLDEYKNIKKTPILGLEDLSLSAALDGVVLLKNDNNLLPLVDKKIAVFGRIQFNYFKSGTGSGGLVNVVNVPSIIECILENPLLRVNNDVLSTYENWIISNPYNSGNGQWASEPWSQVEMELDGELVKKASLDSDVAVIVIGRTAGEDFDNYAGEGSYYLSQLELEMLDVVNQNFDNIVVLLNVGNIIDMSWMLKYKNIKSVLYLWHGGVLGAKAASSIITGINSPSGKLSDTIAYNISDYPSNENFGNKIENYYQEDIYVGYRYFNTFAEDKIMYPFGYGLSYTTFKKSVLNSVFTNGVFKVEVEVENTGNYSGKEVIQLYVNAPNGCLGRPKTELCGFAKTCFLAPKQKQIITISVALNNLSTFDDSGITGYKDAYVLEAGEYAFNLGNSSLDLKFVQSIVLDKTVLVKQSYEAITPISSFKRMKNCSNVLEYEDVPLRTYDLEQRYKEFEPKVIEFNNLDITLEDVYNKKNTLDEFIGCLDVEMLAQICRGEGMSSPKVTSGTAAAFGGVTPELSAKKIPVMCAADGPSGIRMDSGYLATSLPNGTLLACSFNYDLVVDLYRVTSKEMQNYDVDLLLGPGMNIHRHPLNGRNFEYFSEDPLLTGIMAAAMTIGLQSNGAYGTLKHLACNSQETARFDSNSIVSQRALRDIYLKGFEIAIKMAKSKAIMTSYNPINGIWAAGNFDINNMIIRKDFGFSGIIVTDWWAKMNDDQGPASKANTKAMIRSSNDIYMVIPDSVANSNNDNTVSSIEDGSLGLGYLQRCAKNICNFALHTNVFRNQINNTNIEDFGVDKWFDFYKDEKKFNNIKEVYINGKLFTDFNPIVKNYVFDSAIDTLTVDNKTAIIYKNEKSFIVSGDNSVYYFVYNKNVKSSKLIDLENCINDAYLEINDRPWTENNLILNQSCGKTNQIFVEDNSIINCLEGEYITYPIKVGSNGKYIVTLEITCDTSQLAQVPFSIFVDFDNKATITVGATNGNVIHVSSQIIINEGNHYLTFRFNKTGIKVKSIKVIKHG